MVLFARWLILLAMLFSAAGMLAAERGRAAEAEAPLSAGMQQQIDAFKSAHERFLQLYQSERYDEAEVEITKSLAIARRLLGDQHLITATEVNNLAALYASMRRFGEARPLFEEALAVRRQLLPADDPRILATLEDLRLTLVRLGDGAAEKRAIEAMLPFADGEPPRDAARLAGLLDRLGVLDIAGKDYKSARPRLERALVLLEALHGRRHAATAMTLSNLAVVDVKENRPEEALGRFAEVLAIRSALLGEGDTLTLQTMGEIAGLYDSLKQHDRAIATSRAIIALREKAQGVTAGDLAGDHNRLSAFAYRAGDVDLAARELARALEIAEAAGGKDNPALLTYLANLATLLEDLGRYRDAEPVYRRRLAIIEQAEGRTSPKAIEALVRLGALERQLTRYDEAERLLLDAHDRAEEAQPGLVAMIDSTLAGLYRETGRYDDAGTRYAAALALYQADNSTTPDDLARLYDNIGVLNLELNRYAIAEIYHKKALVLFETALGPQHSSVAICLNNLAAVYGAQQRNEEALPLWQRSLAIYQQGARASDPMIGILHDNIAGAYRQARSFENAEAHYRKAMQALVKAHGEEHPDVALAFSNLASLFGERRDFRGADELYAKAIETAASTLGAKHPQMANYHRLRGENAVDGADYAAAGEHYAKALEIAEQHYGPEHEKTGQVVGKLAALHLLLQDYGAALPAYRRAARIEDARLRSRGEGKGEAGAGGGSRDLYAGLAVTLWHAAAAAPVDAAGLREEALLAAQKAQRTAAGAALAQMSARFAAGSGELADAVRERQDLTRRHDKLDKQLIDLIGAPSERRDQPAIDALRAALVEIGKRLDALDTRLARDFPAYASLANPQPLDASAIKATLADDEALLFFLTSNEAVYVWALTRDGADWRRIALKQADLRQRVAHLRAALDPSAPGAAIRGLQATAPAGPVATSFDLVAAHDLYVQLLQPIEALLKDRRHLLVIASDALTGLPLHVLVTAPPPTNATSEYALYQQTRWLIRRHAVTTLPSIASLEALRRQRGQGAAAKALIGFGDPVFSDAPVEPKLAAAGDYATYFRGGTVNLAALSQLAPLPETRGELVGVATTLGVADGDIRLGRDASESEVKQLDGAGELANRRIVYFATHGLIAGDIKGLAEPALALSLPKAASEQDDGLLTASEVTQLRLNADWVVLSACNTASGAGPGAEALSGLARAFFYAGAKSLLVSHWPVYSDAAAELTTSAFRIIDESKTKGEPIGRAEALRRAMLNVLEGAAGGFDAHPSYWAPFVVVGEGAAERID